MARSPGRSRKISGVVLVNWYNKYVGLRFDDNKLNCWGLVCLIYKQELNIDLPSYSDISACDLINVARNITAGKDGEEWVDVDRTDIKEFDIVVMRFGKSRFIGHVGIAIDNRSLLHTEKMIDSCIVPYSHFSVRERIQCIRRHKATIKF